MSWRRARPAPSTRGYDAEHRAARAAALAALKVTGRGRCAEIVCVRRSRLITPAMDLHLCHDTTGTRVLGLGHAECNLAEAGRRARAKQNKKKSSGLEW